MAQAKAEREMIRFVSKRRHPRLLRRPRRMPSRGWAPTCRLHGATAKPARVQPAKRCVRRVEMNLIISRDSQSVSYW